jgi:hypothetical protein
MSFSIVAWAQWPLMSEAGAEKAGAPEDNTMAIAKAKDKHFFAKDMNSNLRMHILL